MPIGLCACAQYRRLPADVLAALPGACRAAGGGCEIVADLCFVAARDRSTLERFASYDAVVACQPRAVRAFFDGFSSPPRCVDGRVASVADLLSALSLPPAPTDLDVDTDGTNAPSPPPEDWTPWFPVIDRERCIDCKKCVDFCLFGVYAVVDGKVRVTRPEACKTDCPACARICPRNAIMFPKSNEDRLNGALDTIAPPTDDDRTALRERLQRRKIPPLFREDDA